MSKKVYNPETTRYEADLSNTSNCITHQEIARVLHADGRQYKKGTLVYGQNEDV